MALALVAFAVAIAAAIVLISVIQGTAHHSSYGDGYRWGYRNAGTAAPECTRAEMASNGRVRDARLGTAAKGDGRPRDGFARWRSGCEAGAKAEVQSH